MASIRKISSQCAENLHSNDSDIELIKTEFNEKLYEHFLLKKNSEERSLLSQNCLDSILLKIKNAEEESPLDSSYIYQDNMMVESIDGKERLFKKDHDGKYKMVLPWEDLFNIFWDTHSKYLHPGPDTFKNILQNDYIVNDFAIQHFYDVCYICSAEKKPYLRCALDIIPMCDSPDFAFTHIMACQDICSGFLHLRPISIDNRESEICIELLKIFMDFGPPKEVIISHDIFNVALDQIKHLTTFAPIPIVITKIKPDNLKLYFLKNNITTWLENQNFENWGIGCYGAQWHLNTKIEPGRNSPFANVFKSLQSLTINEMLEVEFDRLEFPRPNDDRVDIGVSTESPIDFNASSYISLINSVEPTTSDGDELNEVKFDISVFPNANDITDTEVSTVLPIGFNNASSCIPVISSTESITDGNELNEVEIDSREFLNPHADAIDKEVSTALPLNFNASSYIPVLSITESTTDGNELNEVEIVSSDSPSTNDDRLDKEVSTVLPLNCDASSYVPVLSITGSTTDGNELNEVEIVSSESPSPNDDRLDKDVSTELPLNCDASSYVPVRKTVEAITPDSPGTSSSEDENTNTNEALTILDSYKISSSDDDDDDIAEFEEKDPLDIHDTVL